MKLKELDRVPLVYFVQVESDGPIKIGATQKISSRLSTLGSANPSVLRLIAFIRCPSYDRAFYNENALHRKFHANRIRGEWFRPTDELLDWLRDDSSVTHVSASPEAFTHKTNREIDLTLLSQQPELPCLDATEMAKVLGVTKQRLKNLIQEYDIPCFAIGARLRFIKADVLRSLRNHREYGPLKL